MLTTKKYDSIENTKKHQERVLELIEGVCHKLTIRGHFHDASKLESPEKEAYDKYTPALRSTEYASDEYKAMLSEMKPAIQHHYTNNSHHPEFYKDGVDGMSLLDLIEMLCDWRAASERHEPKTDMIKSLEINIERFGISPQLSNIIKNTIKEIN